VCIKWQLRELLPYPWFHRFFENSFFCCCCCCCYSVAQTTDSFSVLSYIFFYFYFSTKIWFRLTAGRWDINEHTDTLSRARVMRSAAVFFFFVFIFSVNSFVFCTFQQLRATLNINAEHVQRLLEQNRCALDVHLCANFSFSFLFKTKKGKNTEKMAFYLGYHFWWLRLGWCR
jgi:hypothetical protein